MSLYPCAPEGTPNLYAQMFFEEQGLNLFSYMMADLYDGRILFPGCSVLPVGTLGYLYEEKNYELLEGYCALLAFVSLFFTNTEIEHFNALIEQGGIRSLGV